MLKRGILNAQLAELLASLGHTDTFIVADCGLPVPTEIPVVDLAVVFGLPRFAPVFEAILAELEVEAFTIAEQTPKEIRSLLPLPASEVSHEELKAMIPQAAFVVRTGETTPFANVVVQSGVPF